VGYYAVSIHVDYLAVIFVKVAVRDRVIGVTSDFCAVVSVYVSCLCFWTSVGQPGKSSHPGELENECVCGSETYDGLSRVTLTYGTLRIVWTMVIE
jgi:hypothetical protein